MKNVFTILFFLIAVFSFGQDHADLDKQVDSIKAVIKKAKHDSTIVIAWRDWDNLIYVSDPDLDFELNQKIENLCKKNLEKKLSEKEKKFFTQYLSFAYNNFGIIYKNRGDYASAIDYYTRSLKLFEKVGEQKGVAGCLGNIGIIYKNQEDYNRAIEYYNKSLIIQEELDDKRGIAGTKVNLGMAYSMKKDLDKALDYYLEALVLYEQVENSRGMAAALNNIGIIYFDKGDLENAFDFHSRCLKLQEQLESKKGISAAYNNLALVYQKKGNHQEAIKLAQKSMDLAIESSSPIEIKDAANTLFNSHKKVGNHKKALEMFELFVSTRDTLVSEENEKEILRQEFGYKYEKQTLEDSLHNAKQNEVKNAQIAQQDAEIRANKIQQYFLFGGLALVLVFAFFMYNRFKVTQKQKHIIEAQEKETKEQKHIIEEKHKEITDSINYAKRIQEAILPSRTSLVQNLKTGFVLYKPKDIVAGDFYWLEKYRDKIYFAAADCTGHGVPGAMVSVVCSNALSKALLEEGIIETGKILDRTRELVIEKFSKSGEMSDSVKTSSDAIKDGMDISLCCLDVVNMNLQWSGANNPLWIIREGTGDMGQGVSVEKYSLIEFKPDKQPIGNYADPKPFTTHQIDLRKGDCIYIFTDGYQDQFGGEKKKKFKASQMKEVILRSQHLSMDEQKEMLNVEFEKWKGSLEQIDDVCVIGVKID